MRIDLNLATRPYQDVRSFYARWGMIVALTALAAAALWGLAVSRYNNTRDVRDKLNQAKAELSRLEEQRKKAEELMATRENAPTKQRSDFLNTLIARKAFSWTQVFTDLESIMPARVQVTALAPEVTKENQLELRLKLSSSNRDAVLELVRKMEGSERFRQAQVRSEARRTNEDTIEFEVSTLYVVPRREMAATAAGGAD
jgi:type IV pilus assembly protein PilN